MNDATERLPRLLALVPYLQARPGVAVADAAADFGITADQLRRDLQLLWMCGLPGHGPGDLIDLSFEGDTVSVIFDAGMTRPLRLTTQEALALAVALRTLAETPGLTDRDAVQRALAKVEDAAGGLEGAPAVSVQLDEVDKIMPILQRALDGQRALALRYYTAARDEVTDRVVDPIRLFELDGVHYLEAWCRRAEGLRVFRADRIQQAELRDEPSRPPPGLELRAVPDLARGLFTPAPEHLSVTLRLAPAYWWVADYYQAQVVDPAGTDPESARLVELRVSDPVWVRSLVLGSDGQVQVLDPPWLADSIDDEARRALAAYGQ